MREVFPLGKVSVLFFQPNTLVTLHDFSTCPNPNIMDFTDQGFNSKVRTSWDRFEFKVFLPQFKHYKICHKI